MLHPSCVRHLVWHFKGHEVIRAGDRDKEKVDQGVKEQTCHGTALGSPDVARKLAEVYLQLTAFYWRALGSGLHQAGVTPNSLRLPDTPMSSPTPSLGVSCVYLRWVSSSWLSRGEGNAPPAERLPQAAQ